MRNSVLFVLLCVVALALAGCLSQEAKQLVADNAQNQTGFVRDLEAGLVNEAQLKENARQNARNWVNLNALVEGEEPPAVADAMKPVEALTPADLAKPVEEAAPKGESEAPK
jgi:hypothetical protein